MHIQRFRGSDALAQISVLLQKQADTQFHKSFTKQTDICVCHVSEG